MKTIIVISLLLISSANARVVYGLENMIPWLMLDNVSARELCLCHYEIDPNTVQLNGTEKATECKLEIRNRVQEKMQTPDLPDQDDLMNVNMDNLRDTISDTEGNDEIICTRRQVKRKISEYKKLQKQALAKWKDDVEKILCHEEQVGRRKASKCREALLDLVSEHEDEVYNRCDESFLNTGRRQVNRCVEENSYKYLMATKDTSFFFDLCQGETLAEKQPCIDSLRRKLKMTYFKEDVKRCQPDQSDFVAEQTTAIKVCEDFLLSKVLGFATDLELSSLAMCLESKSDTDIEGVNQCVMDYRAEMAEKDESNTPEGMLSEKDLIDQLKDRYCPVPLYSANYGQYECVNDLITDYMNDMQLSNDCETSAAVTRAQNDSMREAALAVCQRKEVYNSLLEKNVLEVADCWSRKQYPSMDDRKDCRERAMDIDREIRQCEGMGEKEQIIQCLSNIEDKEALQRYLLANAQRLKIDAQARCGNASGQNYINCMLGMVYQDPELVQRSNPLNCYTQGDPQRCADANYDVVGVNEFSGDTRDLNNSLTDQVDTEGVDAIVNSNGTNGSGNTTGSNGETNLSNGRNGDVLGLEEAIGNSANGTAGVGSTGGSGNNATNGALGRGEDPVSITAGSGEGIDAGRVDSIGLDSVMRYASGAGAEPTGVAPCDTIIEVSREITGAIGVSNITQSIANTKSHNLIKLSNDRQRDSYRALDGIYNSGAQGNGMIAAVGQSSLVKLNEQITAEQRRLATTPPQPPTYCRTASSTWFNKDYEFIKKASRIALHEIENARYKVKMINIFKEWESTFDNANKQSQFSQYDSRVNMDLDHLRIYLTTSIKLLMYVTFPQAHAEEPSSADGISAIDDVIGSIGGEDALNQYNTNSSKQDQLPALDMLMVLRDYIQGDTQRAQTNTDAYRVRVDANRTIGEDMGASF